jgi:hypothetical protein
MPGLCETFVVESDGEKNLQLAVAIPMTWHRHATHFAISKLANGSDCLHLYWTDRSDAKDENFRRVERDVQRLPYELGDPDAAFQFIRGWLTAKDRDFGPESGGDGSDVKGFRVEITNDFYEVMSVTARYNYYSK